MKKFSLIALCFLIYGCGSPNWTLRSLSDLQPHVMNIVPIDQSVQANSSFKLTLSAPINEETVSDRSVLIIEGDLLPEDLASMKDLIREIDKEKLVSIPLNRSLSEEGTTLLLSPLSSYKAGAIYSIVLTSSLMTEDNIPFNQSASGSAEPFIRTFEVFSSSNSASGSNSNLGSETNISSGTADDQVGGVIVHEDRVTPIVLLNEIYFDAPGSDTNGVLFVELKGPEGEDLSGLQINFINGDNGAITDSIIIPDGNYISASELFVIADLSTGSSSSSQVEVYDLLDNFDPQNGPDSVELLFNGELLDRLNYTKITSGFSMARTEEGEWVENEAPSPGRNLLTATEVGH